jgi:rhomboid protease GluP
MTKPPILIIPPHHAGFARAVLVGLVLSCVLPEALLFAADMGLVGSSRWRPLAYQYGAFWPGLLHGWLPNFGWQPVTMFLTHTILHAGPLHLIGNMLALVVLGQIVIDQQGPLRMLLVYLVAALGGGLCFGLLSRSAVPMVGASGAIFGLAGALLIWRWQARQQLRHSATAAALWLLGGAALLIVINLLMWWWQAGQLAWQTHLGGVLAGAATATLLRPYRPILAKIRA